MINKIPKQKQTQKNQSDEGNRNAIRTDGTSGDGRVSPGSSTEVEQGGTTNTPENNREESRPGDQLETDSNGERMNGRRNDGNHVRPSEPGLDARGAGGNRHQLRAGRTDTAAANQTGQKRNSQESLVR